MKQSNPFGAAPIDFLILSNGPGEISTWVLPVVRELRKQWGDEPEKVRISVILSPCPHATGKEAQIAASFPEVDRVQSSEYFFPFLLRGKTKDNWDWRSKGIIIFLGGDQFFAVVIGSRLNYPTVVYAEWDARWLSWIHHFALGQDLVAGKIPRKYQPKCTVVGNLMADIGTFEQSNHSEEIIGLLPGSKAAKLAQGVPLSLAVAEAIARQRPQTRFILPLAPTLEVKTLAQFANPETNQILPKVKGVKGELQYDQTNHSYFLQTPAGVKVELITRFPAFDLLSQCSLCLTTVGANTAQLGTLGVPMLILLPTQQLDAMRSWDGIPGLLANLPGLGYYFASLINYIVIKRGHLFAWPNIWAKEQVVPELVGEIYPEDIALKAIDLLEKPEKLQQMRDRLLQIRPQPGAASRLVAIVNQVSSDVIFS